MRRIVLLVLAALAACDVNPFDQDQVPVVSVAPARPPVISWTPAGAHTVRVYRGEQVPDGYSSALVWELQASDGRNGLESPVTYGETPAGAEVGRPAVALESGVRYTAWVRRFDVNGTGDGFTNTSNTYVGMVTFVAP